MTISANNGQGTVTGGGSSITLSYTVSSGDRQMLCAHIGHGSFGTMTVSSATFNGDALTQEVTNISSLDGVDHRSSQWYRQAPDQTTANLIGNYSSSVDYGVMTAAYLNDAKQQAPEANGQADDTGSPAQVSVTTVTAGAMVIGGGVDFANGNHTPDANTTELAEVNQTDFDVRNFYGYRIGGAAGSYTLGWTHSDATGSTMTAMAFEEDTGGGGGASGNPEGAAGHL